VPAGTAAPADRRFPDALGHGRRRTPGHGRARRGRRPPNVRFSGDLRYRHESINEEGQAERQRQRIRARFGVTADVAENVRVGLTLATGGDDPVSANQSLDTGFSRKPIGVDRAFFTWAATDELTFTAARWQTRSIGPAIITSSTTTT
jgi:hypothetical protein